MEKALVKFQNETNLPAVIQISDDESYLEVGDSLRRIKGSQKELKELKSTMTKPLDQAKKAIMDMFSVPEQLLTSRESALKKAIVVWEDKLSQMRLAEEARLRDERQKLLEAAEAKAVKLESRGKMEQAEMVRDAVPLPSVVQLDREYAEGISVRKVWKFEVLDREALFNAGRPEFWEVNETALRSFARSTKGAITIPGVRFYQESEIAARS